MREAVIENPVINSAFTEPRRHFKFDDDGITSEIVETRRPSAYFIPVAQPKKKGAQLQLGTEWTDDRRRENDYINEVRGDVAGWRKRNYPGVTRTTPVCSSIGGGRARPQVFFCQLEAVETAIYITECARQMGPHVLLNGSRGQRLGKPRARPPRLQDGHRNGKRVMACSSPGRRSQDREPAKTRGSADSFLSWRRASRSATGACCCPTRRQLLPRPRLVPRSSRSGSPRAGGDHQLPRLPAPRKASAGRLTKRLLAGRGAGEASPFKETPDQMVRRVCREFGGKKNIVVLNDEAHHCYRGKPAQTEGEDDAAALTGEERREAQRRDEEARVWISGLEAIKRKIGIRAIYDLSATPFFLRGSGYPEGTLFPWVVSDFSLVDAIECGIVKVPRVPVADDSMVSAIPMYRHLWPHVKDDLPKKGRKTDAVDGGAPRLPKELEGALQSLYGNYEKYQEAWTRAAEERGEGSRLTPPVFIVVCNNTNVSKLVFDWIAGWEQEVGEGDERRTVVAPGNLALFSNVERGPSGENRWTDRPNTILIDSSQLESGEAMSAEFKRAAAREIVEFKAQYRQRFPDRDAEAITDEDLLREVMNTVGKPGRLGEQIRCVVSVSMLTEGWDANTVTHVLGVRAFSTQLLCEQVVGRALRRTTYVTDAETDLFPPEYAEVYGVPFSFIPVGPEISEPVLPKKATRVRALPERVAHELTFPRLTGYRYELSGERLTVRFDGQAGMALSSAEVPTKVEMAPVFGLSDIHTLDQLKARRLQEVDFLLAKLVYETYFHVADAAGEPANRPWLFPQILVAARAWRRECLTCKDDAFAQMLLLAGFAHRAADKIYRAIVESSAGERVLLPIVQPYDPVGSTNYVDFDTTRPVWPSDPDKCHISHVVCDTDSWEQKMAQTLEDMDEVESYVKNHNLGFFIPYTYEGVAHSYIPDFIVRVGALNLVIEVSGEAKPEKAAKVETARSLWVPAVNNDGRFGRWAFLEISDPWDAKNTIRAHLAAEDEA